MKTSTEDLLKLLSFSARHLHSALLMASAQRVPKACEDYQRLTNPRPGDLVMELTSVCRQPIEARIGWLTKVEDRWVPYEDGEDGEGYSERFWTVVKLTDGEPFVWTSALFIVLPLGPFSLGVSEYCSGLDISIEATCPEVDNG